MAKYGHRIFEMYEFHDEATKSLTPKSAQSTADADHSESWSFKHLAISRSASVTKVEFKSGEFGKEHVSGLREDLSQLSECLMRDSKVLFDFAGVKSFGSASIDALALFNRRLRNKGSRIALCCLDPDVKQSFFD